MKKLKYLIFGLSLLSANFVFADTREQKAALLQTTFIQLDVCAKVPMIIDVPLLLESKKLIDACSDTYVKIFNDPNVLATLEDESFYPSINFLKASAASIYGYFVKIQVENGVKVDQDAKDKYYTAPYLALTPSQLLSMSCLYLGMAEKMPPYFQHRQCDGVEESSSAPKSTSAPPILSTDDSSKL